MGFEFLPVTLTFSEKETSFGLSSAVEVFLDPPDAQKDLFAAPKGILLTVKFLINLGIFVKRAEMINSIQGGRAADVQARRRHRVSEE